MDAQLQAAKAAVMRQAREFVDNLGKDAFSTFTMVAVDKNGDLHQLGGFGPAITALSMHHMALCNHADRCMDAYRAVIAQMQMEAQKQGNGAVNEAVRQTIQAPAKPRLIVP